MSIEFDGFRIVDESQANALFAQGFISDNELKKALRQLNSKGMLKEMGDMREGDLPLTLIGKIVRRVQEKLKL